MVYSRCQERKDAFREYELLESSLGEVPCTINKAEYGDGIVLALYTEFLRNRPCLQHKDSTLRTRGVQKISIPFGSPGVAGHGSSISRVILIGANRKKNNEIYAKKTIPSLAR